MIASLCGQVTFTRRGVIVVDVGGVGYAVHGTAELVDDPSRVGQRVELYIHMVVREDDVALYGFLTLAELDSFELLLGVSGIGPRAALSLLSTLSPEALRAAIAQGDTVALARAPGIGRKTAERLVVYLKDKMAPLDGLVTGLTLHPSDAEAISALTALGYSVSEAQGALAGVPPGLTALDERILAALRALGGG